MFEKVLSELKRTFASGKTRTVEWRKSQLRALEKGLKDMQDELVKALHEDLFKPEAEAVMELLAVSGEVKHALTHLDEWTKPQVTPGNPQYPDAKWIVYARPKGVLLAISPFNFPVTLTFSPLVSAIAAGNCVVMKPSEMTPHVAEVLQKLADTYLDKSAIRLIQGSVQETTALLSLPFDHFCYTGNGRVGRLVMKAAAEQLADCTLELGGKSPVYIHEDANLETTAKRILSGKFTNDGQMCIAPDYLLVHEKVRDDLINKMKENLPKFYGPHLDGMGRIVNHHHFDRIKNLLDEKHGGRVVQGGLDRADRAKKYIPPTFALDPSLDSGMMSEEIFGPILPIVAVPGLDRALEIVNSKDNPLAAYVFTQNTEVADRFLSEVRSGGGCVNDVTSHLRNKHLPLGGSGKSGIGMVGGKFGFDEFSYHQAIVEMPANKEEGRMYPPYHAKYTKALRSLL